MPNYTIVPPPPPDFLEINEYLPYHLTKSKQHNFFINNQLSHKTCIDRKKIFRPVHFLYRQVLRIKTNSIPETT